MHAKAKRDSTQNYPIKKMEKDNLHNETTLELIERFYKKELGESELLEFNKRLESDDAFSQLVNDYKLLFEGIETVGMKAQIDEFHKEIEPAELPKKSSWKNLGIAASVIFLLGLSTFLLFNETKEEKLYAKYFKVDPGLPTLMGESDQYQFYNGMVSYKQGKFDEALTIWKTLDTKEISQDTLNYFKGVAFLANGQVDEAIKSLSITTEIASSFKKEAHYYLALAYLKSENVEFAKKNLKLSSIDNSKALLTELNN